MALIGCTACGNEVSSRADTCSRCGAKIVRSRLDSGLLTGLFVFGVLITAIFIYFHLFGDKLR